MYIYLYIYIYTNTVGSTKDKELCFTAKATHIYYHETLFPR